MIDDTQPATKKDVEDIVIKVVRSSTSEILSAVGDQLHTMNEQIDDRFDRLDQKVDNVTDDHEVRISTLEKQQV